MLLFSKKHAFLAPMRASAWTQAMREGHFAAAWHISDAALAARDPATRDDPNLPYHQRWLWDGTPPNNLHVLVRCYHGLGDTLQFARFLPALRRRATRLTLECQAGLCPLFADWPCIDTLVGFDPVQPLPPSACDIEIMELAHVLRADRGSISAPVPYLSVPADRLARGRSRAGGRIALCWQAGDWDTSRSLPLQTLLGAIGPVGRRFISLQRGAAAAEADAAHFANPADDNTDVLETAALICGAERVITVDTMVAHLAGALGRRATVLLKPEPDWRWPVGGARSVWYPTLRMDGLGQQEVRQGLLF